MCDTFVAAGRRSTQDITSRLRLHIVNLATGRIRSRREEACPWRRAAEKIMFEGHDPYLVALSVVIAILGGYTGFGLAARIRGAPDSSRRLLLAGAAFFLA